MADNRKIRARYSVRNLGMQPVTYQKCHIDKDGALQQETVSEEMNCYMVKFPQGHSIRVTSYERLKELGFHLKPRMVDMNTGDVVDFGGDPYNFDDDPEADVLMDDDGEVAVRPPKSKSKENA